MRAYDPIQRLAAREAVRFVGTVGDVMTHVCRSNIRVLDAFIGREVRSEFDLIGLIQDVAKSSRGKEVKKAVAKHTLEVSSALRILEPVPLGSAHQKKYSIGDAGRVVNAMKSHPAWNEDREAAVMRRPMFESNGDYLLQALSALQNTGADVDQSISEFTRLVKDLASAKLQEIPRGHGLGWDVYVQELKNRQSWVGEISFASDEGNKRPTLESLKREKKEREIQLTYPVGDSTEQGGADKNSKTFQHHFNRARSWLSELGLIARSKGGGKLTVEGERILDYFTNKSPNPGPIRIPPSASLLADAFRLPKHSIESAWGVVVDDCYWEEGIFDLEPYGNYEPHEDEFLEKFDWAFEKVRIHPVSEASVSTVRQVLYLAFLWEQRPLRPQQLDSNIEYIFERHARKFGKGMNRQGRAAFVFKKNFN